MAMELEQAAAAMAALTADESRFRLGENGHAELTADGLGDAMLALFDKYFQISRNNTYCERNNKIVHSNSHSATLVAVG